MKSIKRIINPIDLTVLLFVIFGIAAVAVFFTNKMFKSQNAFKSRADAEIVLRIPMADPDIVSQVKKGDFVTIKQSGADLGNIAKISSKPALQITQTSTGKLVKSSSPYYKDLYIYIKSKLVIGEKGFYIGNYSLLVNNEETFLTSNATLNGSVWSIKQ